MENGKATLGSQWGTFNMDEVMLLGSKHTIRPSLVLPNASAETGNVDTRAE